MSFYQIYICGMQDIFLIDDITGIVRVNQNLDRDKVETWTSVVQVVDTAGGADQTATGSY
jgi:hypothetical protein